MAIRVRHLTVHFAPSTAYVVIQLNEDQYNHLMGAIDKHTGQIILEVSEYVKTATMMERE